MKAIVLNIGNELLQGLVINGNGANLAASLREQGHVVESILCIADGALPLHQTLDSLDPSVELVVCTGGLGPTPDDTTRFDIAQYFQLELDFHEDIEAGLIRWCAEHKRPYLESNRVQAMIPRGAEILENPLGTAPGFLLRQGARVLAFMPGVPSEMAKMFREQVLPRLGSSAAKWLRREVVTWGLGEDLQTKLLEHISFDDPILFASLPGPDGLLLRISARGEDEVTLNALLDQKFAQIRQAFAGFEDRVISWEGLKIPEKVLSELLARRQTIAFAESCTGGLLADAMVSQAGASKVLLGSLVAYSTMVKQAVLGVSAETLDEYGSVSEETALEMAKSARKIFNSDWALAVTGLAGPEGGTEELPVGTIWIALAGPHGVSAISFYWPAHRQQIRHRACMSAFSFLLQKIIC